MIDDQDLANVRTAVQSRHLRAGVAMPVRIAEGLLEEADRARLLDIEVDRLDAQRAAALKLADEAEHNCTRWENPLPVPEWVGRLRKALGVTS